MQIRPFNDTSEHDVINLFALDAQSGDIGMLVTIKGSGFQASNGPVTIDSDLSPIANAYIPRWGVPHKVTAAGSGSKPLGFLAYNVREYNFQGVSFKYDPTRKAEALCVASGEAVPIIRKGLFLVGGWTSGQVPLPGKEVVMSNAGGGDWSVAAAGTAGSFGKCLGALDTDGYALVAVDFNKL